MIGICISVVIVAAYSMRCCVLCAVCCVLFALDGVLYTVCCMLCAVCCIRCPVYGVLCAVCCAACCGNEEKKKRKEEAAHVPLTAHSYLKYPTSSVLIKKHKVVQSM
jgi:hypothetical protein